MDGAEPAELKPESPTKLFSADGSDRRIEFTFNGDTVARAAFINNGIKVSLNTLD